MLAIVIADAALELVPAAIARHPIIASHARKRRKKPTELLLDASLHWRAMEKLENRERRGRPDIIHDLIKLALDSQLNKAGRLCMSVHTLEDKVIRMNPETRASRNYNQFVGLIEDLYKKKSIEAEGKRLLWLEEKSLAGLLAELSGFALLVCDVRGKLFSLRELAGFFEAHRDAGVIIGGFPHGDFLSQTALANQPKISLSPVELTAPAVLAKVLSAYEYSAGF
ncbi:MAG: 16S rRNA methyltransferase [Candidatus Micrarchaeia archaeon]